MNPPLRALWLSVAIGAAAATARALWPPTSEPGPEPQPRPPPRVPPLEPGDVYVSHPIDPGVVPPDLAPALWGSGEEWFYIDGWTQHGDTGRWTRRHSEGPLLMTPYDAGVRSGTIFAEVAWLPPPGIGGRHLVRRFQWDRSAQQWGAPTEL